MGRWVRNDRGVTVADQLIVPDLDYWRAADQVPGRLPGPHRRPRLRARHRRGRRRACLPDRARSESARLDLRPRLRRAVRGGLPARRPRPADLDPRAEALRLRALRPRAPVGGRSGLVEFLQGAAPRVTAAATVRGRRRSCCLCCSRRLVGEIRAGHRRSRSAIIGSGPAGLAAAHDLALLGFAVTIYEMEPVLAGMLAVGIPEYRLPRDLIRAEVEVIQRARRRGPVHRLRGRQRRHLRRAARAPRRGRRRRRRQALAHACRSPGATRHGVLGGVEFLRDVVARQSADRSASASSSSAAATSPTTSARTVLRQIALDAARTALRESSVADGHSVLARVASTRCRPTTSRSSRATRRASSRRNSLGPVEILTDDAGRVRGVVFQQVPARVRREAQLRAAVRRQPTRDRSSATTSC